MAGKRGRPKGSGNKSEFIRQADPNLSAAEVVELAEKEGVELTAGLVYSVRTKMKDTTTEPLASIERQSVEENGITLHRVVQKSPEGPSSQSLEELLTGLIMKHGWATIAHNLERIRAKYSL